MSRRRTFPISLYISGRRTLLVGPKTDAVKRRYDRLVAAGGIVSWVEPERYSPSDCDDAFLIFAQTDRQGLDSDILRDGAARGATLLYAHDQPDRSDFAMPALARRGPLTIAISTDSLAPALARRVREIIDKMLTTAGPALDPWLRRLVEARIQAKSSLERSRLYGIAARLRLDGKLTIADEG